MNDARTADPRGRPRGLDAATRYVRRPDLRVELHANSAYRVEWPGGHFSGGLDTLALLAAFDRPRSVREALARLSSLIGGAQHWIDLTAEIRALVAAGVLVDGDTPVPATARGFADPLMQHRMVADRTRTHGFVTAIRATVRPGDVVVDLGTGSCVLAIAAAQAGAARVYAVEASPIADLAEAMIAANGLADRITLLRGYSTSVDLPERATVLVSETLGNEPLSERVEENLRDAFARWLTPDARLIPRAVRLVARAYAAPADALAGSRVDRALLGALGNELGIDFGPLADAAARAPRLGWFGTRTMRDWPSLTAPVLMAERRFAAGQPALGALEAAAEAAAGGELSAVALHFEAELADGITLSTVPECAGADNHWACLVRTIDPPVTIGRGESIVFGYRPGTDPDRLMARIAG
jgi:protein arginine N-methyltransferase 1